jgi:hypothetical protein
MKTIVAVIALTLSVAGFASAGVYEGQIDGDFNGWDGETIYKLMDGHIIQQSSYYYHYHYAYSPHVIIYGSNGRFKMHVEGDDDDHDVDIIVLK